MGLLSEELDGQAKLAKKLNRKMTGELGADLLGLEGRSDDKEEIVGCACAGH
ncbi:MAG: hypothetical protein ACFHHU_00835 [Porticoccaceae bacterium]